MNLLFSQCSVGKFTWRSVYVLVLSAVYICRKGIVVPHSVPVAYWGGLQTPPPPEIPRFWRSWAKIRSLKVPKIKKSLLYEMNFLVPNYSCLQNPWLGAYSPRSRSLCPLSSTEFVEPPPKKIPVLNPPRKKIPWYATEGKDGKIVKWFILKLRRKLAEWINVA
jgi:hypothetical protein